jgi:hypothetical protein
MKLLIPTIHRNGTDGNDLLEQNSDARHAIRLAIKALQNACPNGRDYYPQGDGVIYQAIEQHTKRLKALEAVHNELGEIAGEIADHIL